jgi:uncharacterized membrane protein YjjB (DUF3815 family)
MMSVALQIVGCFAAAAMFALLFRTPARLIVPASLSAVAGYALSLWAGARIGAEWAGIFFGFPCCPRWIGEWLARRLRAPATIFLTVAVIPMVPGAGALQHHAGAGAEPLRRRRGSRVHTMLSAGAIALGPVHCGRRRPMPCAGRPRPTSRRAG